MTARILIVDDSKDILSIVHQLLKRKGYETVEAESGLEALEILRRDPRFDLIISDMRMAHMTGLELLDRLRDDFPTIPTIILSVHKNPEWIDEAMQKGAVGYIAKPFSPEQLIGAVEKFLVKSKS